MSAHSKSEEEYIATAMLFGGQYSKPGHCFVTEEEEDGQWERRYNDADTMARLSNADVIDRATAYWKEHGMVTIGGKDEP